MVSAKGSPGVTTAAMVLAACAGPEGLLVEFDPSGGSIECWTESLGEPGLVRIASALRRTVDPSALDLGTVEVPPGTRSILAPASGSLAESTIAAIGDRLVAAVAEVESTVIIDAGRWGRTQATAGRIGGCDLVLVACRPSLAGIEAARALIDPLRAFTSDVALLLVGDSPYGAAEIAAATHVPVVGTLPWDGRSVNALITSGATRAWTKSGLARSARSILDTVTREEHGDRATTGAVA